MINDFKKYKITYTLIAINLVVYIISAFLSRDIIDMNLEVLVNMGALYGSFTVLKGEWWRLFTAMFLHSGMTHLLMNMFSLYLIGRGAEMYFQKKSYIIIYIASGLVGGLFSQYMHPVSVGIGASGAIFGVFGALAGFFLAFRERIQEQSKAFMKDFGIIIVINLVIGFSISSVDVSAHIAGLVIGFIGGFMVSKNPQWVWIYLLSTVIFMLAMASYIHGQYAKIIF